jgi:hypothetical protein
MVSKMVSKGARPEQLPASGSPDEALHCPRCKRLIKLIEWRLIYRRIRSEDGRQRARLLQHTTCEELIYFVLDSRID